MIGLGVGKCVREIVERFFEVIFVVCCVGLFNVFIGGIVVWMLDLFWGRYDGWNFLRY